MKHIYSNDVVHSSEEKSESHGGEGCKESGDEDRGVGGGGGGGSSGGGDAVDGGECHEHDDHQCNSQHLHLHGLHFCSSLLINQTKI